MDYRDFLSRNNIPFYPSEADYTTNSPSYYENLARKQKLIELLAKKIWEYEEKLDMTLEELETRLETYISENDSLMAEWLNDLDERLEMYITENDSIMTERLNDWDERLEKFPESVEQLLQEWLSDGTLDHIINDTIFNWKVDQTEFDEFVDNTTTQLAQAGGINVRRFGAVGDNETNDYQAFVDAINNAEHGDIIRVPDGNYAIEGRLVVDKRLTFVGSGKMETVLNFKDSSGLWFQHSNSRIESIRVYCDSDDLGEHVGVEVRDPNGERLDNFSMFNVDVSRFHTSFKPFKLWNFDLLETSLSFSRKYGIHTRGLSVNNTLQSTRIVADNGDFGKTVGIYFDGSEGSSEGWMFDSGLIYGFDDLIISQNMSNMIVNDSILDMAQDRVVVLEGVNDGFSGGWQISNNMLLTLGGRYAIHDKNNPTSFGHYNGNIISHNRIFDYNGGEIGVLFEDKSVRNQLSGNRITGYTKAIEGNNETHTINDNVVQGFIDASGLIFGNKESSVTVNADGKPSNNLHVTGDTFITIGSNRIYFTKGLPTYGASKGDVAINTENNEVEIFIYNNRWRKQIDYFLGVQSELPTPSADYRGYSILIGGGGSTSDKYYICLYTSGDGYSWKEIA